MSDIGPNTLLQIICQVCRKEYVHNRNYVTHIKSKFPKEALGILKEQSPSEGKKAGLNNTELNIMVEVDNM